MTESEIRKLLERQRTFFSTGKTLPVSFRLRQLEKLKRSIQKNEPLLRHALKKDLGKSNMESYMCEIGLTLSELSWMQRHVRSLAKNRTVPTPLSQFAAHSYRSPIPYGTVLIMSPWNYPLLLTLEPLIDAIAAGNTVILKPSAYAPASLAMIKEITKPLSRQIIFPSLREDVQKIRHCSARSLTRSFLPEARLSERKFCGMPQRI